MAIYFDGKHSDSGESYSDGLTMDAFRRMVNQKKNWVMINSKFSITNGGRTVEAREVYYDNGVVKVREANSPMNERVYEMVTNHFNITKSEVLFISSNGWDIAGAARHGYKTVWINRTNLPQDRLAFSPDFVHLDLNSLLPIAKNNL